RELAGIEIELSDAELRLLLDGGGHRRGAHQLQTVARLTGIARLPRELRAQQQHPSARLRVEGASKEIRVERPRLLGLALLRGVDRGGSGARAGPSCSVPRAA